MVREVSKVTTPKHVAISLPSLRADRMSVEVADSVRQIKHSGFTFAPEAGSVRLRRVINKNITNEELLAAIRMALEKVGVSSNYTSWLACLRKLGKI